MSSSYEANSPARRRILEAAIAALEQGHDDVLQMGTVAKRAGVSRQAVYLHFRSRAELAIAVARYTDEKYGLDEAVRPIAEATDAEGMLTAYAAFLAGYNPRIHLVVRMASTMRRSDPASEAAWQDRLRNRRRNARRMAKRLQTWQRLNGDFSLRTAADWLTALGSVALWEELVLDLGWSHARFRDTIARNCCRTLLTDP
ncbi:MAG: helix-turn-helix domain-containing protein [Pseudomonadales bacterium]